MDKRTHKLLSHLLRVPQYGPIDVQGSYTGMADDGTYPVQDADDL